MISRQTLTCAARSGINAQMLTGGQITGRVTSAAGAGIAGVTVCAQHASESNEIFRNQTWGRETECAITSGPGGSASATSNTLAVRAAHRPFKLLRTRFDRHSGKLDFFLETESAGRLRWLLFFANTDVRLSKHQHGTCKRRHLKHRSRCLPLLVAFSSGARRVHRGIVAVQIRASALARHALSAGRGSTHTRDIHLPIAPRWSAHHANRCAPRPLSGIAARRRGGK
jgi:hypothetical protein